MVDSEKISGEKIFKILEQLRNDHTILNIHIMGTDFDGFSIVLGVSYDAPPGFLIDYPGKAESEEPLSVGRRCYFEFSDDEKIKYSFKTTVESILGKRIKFNFPEYIERSQRRKAFRVTVPSGTKLNYKKNDEYFSLDTLNISEGGALVTLKNKEYNRKIFFNGNKLKKLSLISESEYGPIRINIEYAEIVRLEKNSKSERVTFGMKFIDIDKNERDEIKKFVYYCQRRLLKKRGEIGGD